MRSSLHDILPSPLRRSLTTFGKNLAAARRKRHLTTAMMAERLGVGKNTYTRVEKGDPTVAMGAYAMALFVLGFGEVFSEVANVRRDDEGLLLDEERLPQRIRVKKLPTSR